MTSLLSQGYRRAYVLPAGYQQGTQVIPTYPAIDLENTSTSFKTSSFQVAINFSVPQGTTTTFYPPVTVNGNALTTQSGSLSIPLTLARYLRSTTIAGNYILEGFGPNDFALDQSTSNGLNPPGDVPQSLITKAQQDVAQQGAATAESLVIGLYAIAYGRVQFSTPIYSTPTALGFIHYSNNVNFTATSNP